MIKEAIDKIIDLAAPNVKEFFGQNYSDKGMTLVRPPSPVPLETDSLSSIVQYLKAPDLDVKQKAGSFIHIISPTSVRLVMPLDSTEFRATLMKANHPAELQTKIFGSYYDIETFIIKMKTQFVETDASRAVIQLVGNIRDERVAKVMDDGISQKVTTSTGVASVGEAVIPNPVILKPYRTFFEIDQPASPFLLRMKQNEPGKMPSCALFEADGGMWQKEAMEEIQAYLKHSLPDVVVLA